jgi:hypothetical protein
MDLVCTKIKLNATSAERAQKGWEGTRVAHASKEDANVHSLRAYQKDGNVRVRSACKKKMQNKSSLASIPVTPILDL